ncbi:Thermostable monoacylglycerol lipase [Achromobacter mucicolens]|uniref:alpha/beta hydrolase n=1 Tax=Achromobacter mucicolens TaxID=1389922 RepID=UPI001466820B|nr:alpha/beta fold hydrolase [Achromobacter mucicolens]CAB3658206.1 Thermostable monoacylglycerol lipase [Achromobacter mucicolens]
MTTIDMLCKVGAFPDRCEASVTRTATACDGPLPPLEPQAGEQLLVGKGDRARTGILLIHRLGGAPWEMHELALGLNEQGYSVMAVKLAGHCGSLQELAGAGWMDWLASVRRGADTLASRTDRVVVGGISTGAVLALALAQERPFHVAGVLALSPVLRHDGRAGPRGASTALLLLVLRVLGIARHRALPGRLRRAGLPGTPWGALGQMRKLAAAVLRRMDMVRAPCLVIHARHDDVATVSGAFEIAKTARNANVHLQLLADREHVITMGRGCGDVVSRATAFVSGIAWP